MTEQPLYILQICRRFGPVGGMERYVWELCRELAAAGHHVEVVCEVNLSPEPLHGVAVHVLGTVRPKPRWLAHLRFSRHVRDWLTQHPDSSRVIHSHERTNVHHVTTFHGPPFATVRELPLWKRFSLRVKMNSWLEKHELCGQQVQAIIPNSGHIAAQLTHYYPEVASKLTHPIAPGVRCFKQRAPHPVDAAAGIIGFVGKEWKRKGLPKAIALLEQLSQRRPNLQCWVIGPNPSEIEHLFQQASFSFKLLGERKAEELYPQMDLLLHPANKEPYGMVITEALAAGVGVVISDVCGAASEVNASLGDVLSLDSDIMRWSDAVDARLQRAGQPIHYQRSWQVVAQEHLALYQQIQTEQEPL